ncbi:MAG: glycoside hydrolase family 5 protein [Chlamydiales bacterium]|nr:glycoside hydrolase family 5 protein [Chlamydiales bacterium]
MKFFLTLFLFSVTSLFAEAPLPWLTAKKTDIVSENGQAITLKGINIGGWLQEEMWMIPVVLQPEDTAKYETIVDHVTLWKAFETRFGPEKMENIRTAYRNAWIQEDDFYRIKQAGFNTVRLPFFYDLVDEPKGLFYWLDKAVAYAQKHGLYLVLDMHGVPGRQSGHMNTGQINQNKFFKSKAHIQQTCQIWKDIAKRYKDCSNIAGYDLLNEPTGATNSPELYSVYTELYKAVREEDKKHIIFIEDGFRGIEKLPRPKDKKWENVIMSTHFYLFEQHTADEYIRKLNEHLKKVDDHKKKIQIPHYLGEFNTAPLGTFDALKRTMNVIRDKKVSYSFWNYKIGRRGHSKSMWGLYYAPGRQKNIDPFEDSYKTIIKKMKGLSTDNYQKHSDLVALFKN